MFRLNDVPKNESSALRSLLHAISNPHTHSTFPGGDPRINQSHLFNWLAAIAGLGIILTSILGVILAFRFSQRPILVLSCLLIGLIIPILALYLAS